MLVGSNSLLLVVHSSCRIIIVQYKRSHQTQNGWNKAVCWWFPFLKYEIDQNTTYCNCNDQVLSNSDVKFSTDMPNTTSTQDL
jgi:hypothetical protein